MLRKKKESSLLQKMISIKSLLKTILLCRETTTYSALIVKCPIKNQNGQKYNFAQTLWDKTSQLHNYIS